MTTTTKRLSETAKSHLNRSGHDPAKVQEAWDRGDYGTLCVYGTGEEIRAASQQEAEASFASGDSGAFDLDGETVYVEP